MEYEKCFKHINKTIDLLQGSTYNQSVIMLNQRINDLPLEFELDNVVKLMLKRSLSLKNNANSTQEVYGVLLTTLYMMGSYISDFIPKKDL